MSSSEDYTLVWIGILIASKPEAEAAAQGDHPAIRAARRYRLETWCETLLVPGRGTKSCILIGKHVATLGYKEGVTEFRLSDKRIQRTLARMADKLRRLRIKQLPRLHILVHVEDVDQGPSRSAQRPIASRGSYGL